jgi:hypothetical protein
MYVVITVLDIANQSYNKAKSMTDDELVAAPRSELVVDFVPRWP